MDRREFLENSTVASGLTLAASALARRAHAKRSPNDRIVVACAGVRGRGGGLLEMFASSPEVEVKYICDIDRKVLEQRAERTQKQTGRRPQTIIDFRDAIADPEIDAIVLGTPTHWHAIPTILACQAGKDVYVEKPDAHNLIEGRIMVAAAKRHKRVVQLGTQARSRSLHLSAQEYLREGHLGKVRFGAAWESSQQGNIGYPPDSDPPPGVDYDLWLGPAPKRPFNVRRFHGSWRWFFDYGAGDLGNDGVHLLDVCRWSMETAIAAEGGEPMGFPVRVSAHGGKYYFDDMQEWPDTFMATYDYAGGYLMTYEMRIWSRYRLHDESEGAAVYGDQGYIILGNRRWRAFDKRGKLIREEDGRGSEDILHVHNFLDCIRSRKKPNADLETVGHPSSALCHVANAAWRANRTLRFDPDTYTFLDDEDANQYLTRPKYREPWVLPKLEDV